MKILLTAAAFTSLLFATSAFAQKSSIDGYATDGNGRPLKNAQIRIQLENAKRPAVIAKTDGKGHFVAAGLPVGSYNVAVLIGGKVTSSAPHVKIQAEETVRLRLGGKEAAVATEKKKHYVWVPASTGSHMGGHYEEGANTSGASGVDGRQNVDRMGTEQLIRLQSIQPTGRAGSGTQ